MLVECVVARKHNRLSVRDERWVHSKFKLQDGEYAKDQPKVQRKRQVQTEIENGNAVHVLHCKQWLWNDKLRKDLSMSTNPSQNPTRTKHHGHERRNLMRG